MNFTRLEKDISYVKKLPDIPTLENGYTPDSLKASFDKAGEDIKEYVNTVLIDELERGGAERIGTDEIETVSGGNVQEVLEGLAGQIQSISNLSIPDGTIVPEKFIPSVASFITAGSTRAMLFSEPGTHSFIPTRTGNYKVSVQGAGGGGNTIGIYDIPCGGGSGASAIAWLWLEAGHEYTVSIGEGGSPIKLNDEREYISNAKSGGASAFYDGDTELIYAGGGMVGFDVDNIPVSRGGLICRNGEAPMTNGNLYSTKIYMSFGAPSLFSGPTCSKNIEAGLGAGGHGANCSGDNIYSYAGGKGGNGAVLIEWME